MKKILSIFIIIITIFTLASCAMTCTVTFDSNGGSKVEAIEVNRKEVVAKPNDPKYLGHIFIGWELNGEEYDFSKPVTQNITLVAKWEKNLTDENISLITGIPLYDVKDFREQSTRAAEAAIKYHFTMDSFEEEFGENPASIIESERFDDYLNYIVIYLDVLLEIEVLSFEIEEPSPTREYKNALEDIWMEFTQSGYYVTDADSEFVDEPYLNVVAPIIIGYGYELSGMIFNGEFNPALLFSALLSSESMLYFQNVSRDGDIITFENLLTEYKYSLSLDELSQLLEGCKNLSELSSGASEVLDYYQECLTYEYYQNALGAIVENDEFFETRLEEKTAKFASVAKAIYDVKDIVSSYETKINNIAEKFARAKTEEEQKEVIVEARNFALQVIDLIEDILPSNEDIEAMYTIGEELESILSACVKLSQINSSQVHVGLPGYVIPIQNTVISIKNNKILTKLMVEGLRNILNVLKDVTVEDIEQVILLALDPRNEEALSHISSSAEQLLNKLNGKDYSHILTEEALESLKDYFYDIIDEYIRILSITLDFNITEELMQDIFVYVEEYIGYLVTYDQEKLSSLMENIFITDNMTLDILNEACDFINFMVQGCDVDFLMLLEKPILNIDELILNIHPSIEEIYDSVMENQEICKNVASWGLQATFVSLQKYNFIDNIKELNKKNISLLEKYATEEFYELFGQLGSNMKVLTEEEISKLYEIADKSRSEFTEEDYMLIDKYNNNSPVSWIFPDVEIIA